MANDQIDSCSLKPRRARTEKFMDSLRRRGARWLALSVCVLFASCGSEPAAFINLFVVGRPRDPGPFMGEMPLRLETYVANAAYPVAMAFLPDGTLLYTEKDTGRLRAVASDGTLMAAPVFDAPVANLGDSGLLGLALDPDFANNGFVFLGFTANDIPLDNVFSRTAFRIVRITLDGVTVVPGSEILIRSLDSNSPLPGHEGGSLVFGPDGKLYVSIGDRRLNTFENEESQDPAILAGKMIRMNSDGSIPADNPYGADTLSFAIGLRNTFDFTFDPITGGLFGPENGAGPDELNLVVAGKNYGWPLVQGAADTDEEMAFAAATPDYTEPLVGVNVAPTGVMFNPTEVYGAALKDQLFVAYFETGTIDRFLLSGDRTFVVDKQEFAAGIPGGMNDLVFGPDGYIYVSTEFDIFRLIPE